MSTFSLEKKLDKETNKFRVSVVAALRARVINEKENDDKKSFAKVSFQALEEVLNHKVKYVEAKKKSK
ncbi:MAG: DNA-directed RNA polymerase subunit omega [Candidatus Firestonebacteria bacterium]|jgi:DNA-directed RNA polymerase subunit K/omega|nr:DNA-directed RNA polymerase subunit omega [Candidatus Firestonebacteria bacterium]